MVRNFLIPKAEGTLRTEAGEMKVALAIFKTKLFAFFADPRLRNFPIEGIPLTEILADLTLKIFLSNDLYTLGKLTGTQTLYLEPNGQLSTAFNVMFTGLQTEKEAKDEYDAKYDAILNITLTYQDRFAI